MPTPSKKAALQPGPRTVIVDMIRTLHEDDIVKLEAIYRAKRFRYLFDGGDMVDVIAVQDDSDLRAWVIKIMGADGIVGCAIVDDNADTVSFMSGPL